LLPLTAVPMVTQPRQARPPRASLNRSLLQQPPRICRAPCPRACCSSPFSSCLEPQFAA